MDDSERDDFLERQRLKNLAQRSGFAFADLDRIKPGDDVNGLLPLSTMRRLQIRPLKRDGNNLWLAMADTTDLLARAEVKEVTNCRVIPVVFVPSALEKWLTEQKELGA